MTPFDIGKLDDVIHGRVRLGVMAYLAQAEAADFTELKTLLDLTQGNLSVHLRKLEEAGYVSIDKSFLDRKPLTRVRMTERGAKRSLRIWKRSANWSARGADSRRRVVFTAVCRRRLASAGICACRACGMQ